MLEFIHPEDHALVLDRHVRRLRGEDVPSTYPLRMLRRDGTSFWTQLNAVKIEWKGRTATLNIIRDISEQKRFEEQFAAAERLRSIGTLAGGIAHDFNNILMGIQGNVSLLLLQLDPASPLRARLEDIEHCVESDSELSARILGFAQGGCTTP
jgi:signal transduction histidine kinase